MADQTSPDIEPVPEGQTLIEPVPEGQTLIPSPGLVSPNPRDWVGATDENGNLVSKPTTEGQNAETVKPDWKSNLAAALYPAAHPTTLGDLMTSIVPEQSPAMKWASKLQPAVDATEAFVGQGIGGLARNAWADVVKGANMAYQHPLGTAAAAATPVGMYYVIRNLLSRAQKP